MVSTPYRIGTRGSPLAIAQTHAVVQQLKLLYPTDDRVLNSKITIIQTTGDKVTDRPLVDIGGKGLFAKEIELALLDNQIDMAIHCVKDLDSILPDNLVTACVLKREDARDVLISSSGRQLKDLPKGSLIGTCSPRRTGQILRLRPDLKIGMMRGNIQTRLKKLENGDVDALILAYSGLKRMNLESIITEVYDVDMMLPAVGQGALMIQCHKANESLIEFLQPLHDVQDGYCIQAERAFLKELGGTCRTPIAGYALIVDSLLTLSGQILSPNGQQSYLDIVSGSINQAESLGITLAKKLKNMAGPDYERWKQDDRLKGF